MAENTSGGGSGLPPLILKIIGDISGVRSAFLTVGGEAKKLASTMSKPMAQARASLDKFGTTLTRFVAPVAAAATAWASFSSIMTAFERAETLTKLADGLGLSAATMAKLGYAADLSASSAEELALAMNKMNVLVGQAAEGGAEATATLNALGLTVDELAGLSSDKVFYRMADALNDVSSQGEKAKLGMAVFGKGARNIATLAAQGGDAVRALGDEGERTGRVMSQLDFAKLAEAKQSLETMAKAFSSLADRAAIALAPLFDWVSKNINAWIGDTRRFDSVFMQFCNGAVAGIGAMKMAWQGLRMAVGLVAATIADLSANFTQGLIKAISYTVAFIRQKFSMAFEVAFRAGKVAVDALVVAFVYLKEKAIVAISSIGETFGKMIRGMGEAAAASRIKGLADIGRSAQEAGAELIVGSIKLQQGTKGALEAAQKDLEKSTASLASASYTLMNMPVTAFTPKVDAAAAKMREFSKAMMGGVEAIAEEVRSQIGGNAITDALASWLDSYNEFQKRAEKTTEQGAADRVAVVRNEFKQYEEYLKAAGDRHKQYVFDLWRRTVDAAEKVDNVNRNSAMLNKSLMAEQDAAHAEFIKTREAREHAATIAINERRIKAEEELSDIQLNAEAERQARIAEQRTAYEKEDLDAHNTIVAQWESGAKGKAEVMSNFFGQMSAMMESKNRQMFEVGKAAAIAQTIVDTYRGAQAAFTAFAGNGAATANPGMVAAGIAAAGAAIVAGFARVQAIRSTTMGSSGGGSAGGGGGSYGSAGGSTERTGQQNLTQQVNISMTGQTFTQEQVRGLVSAINGAAGDNVQIKVA